MTNTSKSPTKTEANLQNPYKGQRHAHSTQKFSYEFGGPVGALLTTILLPIIILFLAHFAARGKVDYDFIVHIFKSSSPIRYFFLNVTPNFFTHEKFDLQQLGKCMGAVLLWFLFQLCLERFLPCDLIQGAPIRGNSQHRLTYRINGHLSFWTTLCIAMIGWPYWYTSELQRSLLQFGRAPIHYLYDYYTEIATAVILWCFLLSIYLYISSFWKACDGTAKILAEGGTSGNHIYDFFIGRELNPRALNGTFDWKEFCELRPGLIGWILLNSAFLCVQQEKLGYVSWSMILVNVFQFLYVWDALYQESAILTTMDITTDGFGFMLVFGDMAWVPFTYSLQARYLVDYDPSLTSFALIVIVLINMIGYFIFRSSNSQKDSFRRNPLSKEVAHLQYLETKRGTRLLTSGWWGVARKINYTGDWIMGLSWCLFCGFDSVVPYFYAIYFLILLVHRSERDDHMCQMKYGEDWNTYKEVVPYRFVPGLI